MLLIKIVTNQIEKVMLPLAKMKLRLILMIMMVMMMIVIKQ